MLSKALPVNVSLHQEWEPATRKMLEGGDSDKTMLSPNSSCGPHQFLNFEIRLAIRFPTPALQQWVTWFRLSCSFLRSLPQ